MTQAILTEANIECARDNAIKRVRAEFEDRLMSRHDATGVVQLISNACDVLRDAARGLRTAAKARDPGRYLANEIRDSERSGGLDFRRKAEHRIGLEILADELGVRESMLRALSAWGRIEGR